VAEMLAEDDTAVGPPHVPLNTSQDWKGKKTSIARDRS
jgi:hypothetical protein